jgi:carboxymethylenebutenolidase
MRKKKKVSRREVLKTAGVITASAVGAKSALAKQRGRSRTAPAQAEPSGRNERAKTAAPALSREQQFLEELWEEHLASEFKSKNADAAVDTMVEMPSVNHVPVMTGGVGRKQLAHFYAKYFIPRMPPDTQIIPISRTIGHDRLVDEFVFKFTHTVQMDWLLPGVAPTNKPVEVVKVVVVQFQDGKIAAERIHWDQASVLVQIGLLDPDKLPVAGVSTARKVLDPQLPSNELMKRTIKDKDL